MLNLPSLPLHDERLRRIASAAAKGGGGMLGVGTAIAGTAVGLAAFQAHQARRTIGTPTIAPPYADGRYLPAGKTAVRGVSLRLAVLGDSGAASLGAGVAGETIGATLAAGLADASGRAVVLSNAAVVGAQSSDLAAQIERVLTIRPHVAVIVIGGNDVTHLVRPGTAARILADAVRELRSAGVQVVVGTCPDLGAVRPLGAPLRQIASRLSRELATAQRTEVVAAGGRAVPLAEILNDLFYAEPDVYFSSDKFHPSSAGYRAVAYALLPEVLKAAGISSEIPALTSGSPSDSAA
jgi:lysophospholipase L1-like esterase